MATGSLNLFVSKKQFMDKIQEVDTQIGILDDIISDYNEARNTLDQFIGEEDSTYELWLQRIDENVRACRKERAALTESKKGLMEIVDKMDDMGNKAKSTVEAAVEATKSSIEAAIKIAPLL